MFNHAKTTIRNNPVLFFIVLCFLKPKKVFIIYLFPLVDYFLFKKSISISNFDLKYESIHSDMDEHLLLVFGKGMGVQWIQLWSMLGIGLTKKHYKISVLTSKKSWLEKLYSNFFNFNIYYLEDIQSLFDDSIAAKVAEQLASLDSFEQIKNFNYGGVPYGKMSLSTFARIRAQGIIDLRDASELAEVKQTIIHHYKLHRCFDKLFENEKISCLFFTEIFMEEYGPCYYTALLKKKNIIRFSGTVRDDCVVLTRMTKENDRTHFSSFSDKSWERILGEEFNEDIERRLKNNFDDRYSDKWELSKRNQFKATISDKEKAREHLKLEANNKVAVIYSHILYDTLFFNGEDLFPSYSAWLIETVKAACENPNVKWFIKIHPSNLWRGEVTYYHKGKYEEVRLIEEHIGALPEHVNLIYPDTLISPMGWMALADYCVTVRGTSGIELGALNKIVVTAGTGRYEHIGFTKNSKNCSEYIEKIKNIEKLQPNSKKAFKLAKTFAYSTFCLKPVNIGFLKERPKFGKSQIFDSSDLVYLVNPNFHSPNELIKFNKIVEWVCNSREIDLLNDWGS